MAQWKISTTKELLTLKRFSPWSGSRRKKFLFASQFLLKRGRKLLCGKVILILCLCTVEKWLLCVPIFSWAKKKLILWHLNFFFGLIQKCQKHLRCNLNSTLCTKELKSLPYSHHTSLLLDAIESNSKVRDNKEDLLGPYTFSQSSDLIFGPLYPKKDLGDHFWPRLDTLSWSVIFLFHFPSISIDL